MDKRNSKTNLVGRVKELEWRLDRVYEAGMDGIGHVAIANYQSRENEAVKRLDDAMWEDRYEIVRKG